MLRKFTSKLVLAYTLSLFILSERTDHQDTKIGQLTNNRLMERCSLCLIAIRLKVGEVKRAQSRGVHGDDKGKKNKETEEEKQRRAQSKGEELEAYSQVVCQSEGRLYLEGVILLFV